MHRFYADGLGEIGSLVTLSEEDARHASRVLRMQPGDAAELFLDGRRFSAEIAEMTAEGVTARLISELPSTEAKLIVRIFHQNVAVKQRADNAHVRLFIRQNRLLHRYRRNQTCGRFQQIGRRRYGGFGVVMLRQC